MPPATATFMYTLGPEREILEKVDWFGRYTRMKLVERSDHSMVVCFDNLGRLTGCYLKVTTRPLGTAVEVHIEAWVDLAWRGEWGARPGMSLYGPAREKTWNYAIALARYLGVAQPESVFTYTQA